MLLGVDNVRMNITIFTYRKCPALPSRADPMNTRFHDHDYPLMRICSKISAIPRDLRILNQKIALHISKNISRSTQHRTKQQVPPTDRATTIFQYSKIPGRHDLLEHNESNQISKFTSHSTRRNASGTTLSAMRCLPIHTPSTESFDNLAP
jgi:hypothetical protein